LRQANCLIFVTSASTTQHRSCRHVLGTLLKYSRCHFNALINEVAVLQLRKIPFACPVLADVRDCPEYAAFCARFRAFPSPNGWAGVLDNHMAESCRVGKCVEDGAITLAVLFVPSTAPSSVPACVDVLFIA
jgi:hypothetical protein